MPQTSGMRSRDGQARARPSSGLSIAARVFASRQNLMLRRCGAATLLRRLPHQFRTSLIVAAWKHSSLLSALQRLRNESRLVQVHDAFAGMLEVLAHGRAGANRI